MEFLKADWRERMISEEIYRVNDAPQTSYFPSARGEYVETDFLDGLWDFAKNSALCADFGRLNRDTDLTRFEYVVEGYGGLRVVDFGDEAMSFDVFEKVVDEYGLEKLMLKPKLEIIDADFLTEIPALRMSDLGLRGCNNLHEVHAGAVFTNSFGAIDCGELKFISAQIGSKDAPVERFEVRGCKKLCILPERIYAKVVIIDGAYSLDELPEIYGCERLKVTGSAVKIMNRVTKQNILDELELGGFVDLDLDEDLMEDLFAEDKKPSRASEISTGIFQAVGSVLGNLRLSRNAEGSEGDKVCEVLEVEELGFNPSYVQGLGDSAATIVHVDAYDLEALLAGSKELMAVDGAINLLNRILSEEAGAATMVINGLFKRVDELSEKNRYWKAFWGKLVSELKGENKRAPSDAVEISASSESTMVLHQFEMLKLSGVLEMMIENVIGKGGELNEEMLKNIMITMGINVNDPLLDQQKKNELAWYLKEVLKKVQKYKAFKKATAVIRDEEEKLGHQVAEGLGKGVAGMAGRAAKVGKIVFGFGKFFEGGRSSKWERLARDDED